MTIPPFILDLVIKGAKDVVLPAVMKELKGGTDGEKIIQFRKGENNNNVVVFIHGFTGSPVDTFENIPQLIGADKDLSSWDVYSVGYSSSLLPDITAGLWAQKPDLDKLAIYLETSIKNHFKDYDRVVLIAHSMGGLISQRCILRLKDDDFNRISHFMMFATPSAGLKKARFLRWINKALNNMSDEGEFVQNLRAQWKERFNEDYPFSFHTVAGASDDFVPTTSSLDPFDERFHSVINGNHVTLVKADDLEDKQSQCFVLIKSMLEDQGDALGKSTQTEKGIISGAYWKTINQYEKNWKELDRRGIKKYVFALEGVGRREEAMDVLRQHPLLETDGDMWGILGGRYKRQYLLNSTSQDAKEAQACYEKGLKMAEERNNSDQIYYHAINLAFIHLVANDNKTEMKKYAQMALDVCKSDSINLWEIATIGEAHLYLGNMDESKKYYEKVLEITKDRIRERNSIYINAKFGYEALQGY